MRERLGWENNLSYLIETQNMNRRCANFIRFTADCDNQIQFHRLQYNELILFALGTYQIRQVRSYYGGNVRFHGRYRIEICTGQLNSLQYNTRGSGDTTLIRDKITIQKCCKKAVLRVYSCRE